MSTDLTDADLDYLCIALRKVQGPTARINKRDKIAFAYGLAAGRARAIEEAAQACDDKNYIDPLYWCGADQYYAGHADAVEECAAAIRALNAPAASADD